MSDVKDTAVSHDEYRDNAPPGQNLIATQSVNKRLALSTYTNGQKGNSNHVVATWSLTITELTLLCNCIFLDIC